MATTTTKLSVSSRDAAGSRAARRLRREGRVLGVVYGGGEEPLGFDADARDLVEPDPRPPVSGEAVEAMTWKGELYGVPYALDTAVLLRNTELAPDQPATFEELLASGAALRGSGRADRELVVQVGAEGDPYYPIPKPECTALYNRYKELADATPGVHFVGRLATYKYYNMDQVVAQALATYARITGRKRAEATRAVLPVNGERRAEVRKAALRQAGLLLPI